MGSQTKSRTRQRVHKREKKVASGPSRHEVPAADKRDAKARSREERDERASPVAERAADPVVQRATQGMMRLQSQRRLRVFCRRLCWFLAVVAAMIGLGYYFADAIPTEMLTGYWDQLKDKFSPAMPAERS